MISDSERAELEALRAEVQRLRAERAASPRARHGSDQAPRRLAAMDGRHGPPGPGRVLMLGSVLARYVRAEILDTDKYVATVTPLGSDPRSRPRSAPRWATRSSSGSTSRRSRPRRSRRSRRTRAAPAAGRGPGTAPREPG
ncbi:hypothetical protein NKG05_21255 [Oerskovia sp. M15]